MSRRFGTAKRLEPEPGGGTPSESPRHGAPRGTPQHRGFVGRSARRIGDSAVGVVSTAATPPGPCATQEGPAMAAIEPSSELLDIATLAARLNVRVRYIRRLVDERRIPYIKLGHFIRFDPAEITTWLDHARITEGPDSPTR